MKNTCALSVGIAPSSQDTHLDCGIPFQPGRLCIAYKDSHVSMFLELLF